MRALARASVVLAAAVPVLSLVGPASAGGQVITEFTIPTQTCAPAQIVAGPDGNLWFTESNANQIGRLTTSGVFTEFPTPTVNSHPVGITVGPDGNLWFTESNPNATQIGRMTPAGDVTEFPILPAGLPVSIAAGSDGNLWFTLQNTDKIGRITPGGVMAQFPVAHFGGPADIVAGPDGNLWFTETGVHRIGRITPAGAVTEFPLIGSGSPKGIAVGPDGNLWFTEQAPDQIGRMNTAGVVTGEFPVPTAGAFVEGITTGPDGNLWFTEFNPAVNGIGRITTGGAITEFPIGDPRGPLRITAGPDGALWFTEGSPVIGTNHIGRITTGVGPACTADIHTLCLGDGKFSATASFKPTPTAASLPATAVRLTDDSGYFWFFDPANIELIVKVLDGCAVNGHSWVFAGGLTNVGVELKVIDMRTGTDKTYSNDSGNPFQPIQDSSAFACP